MALDPPGTPRTCEILIFMEDINRCMIMTLLNQCPCSIPLSWENPHSIQNDLRVKNHMQQMM